MKNNKNMNRLFLWLTLSAILITGSSCTDYLDKAPNSDIEETTPYANFRNFQGYVEELYNCIPVVSNTDYHNSFNLGEDVYWEPQEMRVLARSIDYGDFWGYTTCYYGYPSTIRGGEGSASNRGNKGNLWKLCWYGINKANIGISKLDKLMDATPEERKLVEGQLYFFRGLFHFMLMEWWGGIPYLDKPLPSGETPQNPRETWQACADKCVSDFDRATELLPIDWDQTTAGKTTLGNNNMRANKIMALAYKGKTLLWAGSPLMNWDSHNRDNSYRKYDVDYCKRASDALGEALKLTEQTGRYELAPMDKFNDIFLLHNPAGRIPGLKEAILQENLAEFDGRWAWNMNTDFRTARMIPSGIKCWPTANYSDYFGMANGYPIKDMSQSDKESGYDATHPWKGRDPRFYKTYVVDGEFCGTSGNGETAMLYTGGADREQKNPQKGCYTGLMNAKLCLKMVNNANVRDQYFCVLSLMRLADVYLMYSEATAVGYGVKNASTEFDMTAEQAINKIRQRAGVANVLDKFTTNTENFLDEVRRERATELAFEGFRLTDLRRWMLVTQRPYTLKTGFQFDRGEFNKENPTESSVKNLRETVLMERKYTDRHYWFPLPNKNDTYLYEGFEQNPGW
jgi:hypothetical protein